MNRTPVDRPRALAAAALLTVLALSGCADAAPSRTTPTSTPTVSTKPGPAELEKVEGACEDGVATVTRNNAEVAIAGDCDEVRVSATNTLVTVGAVEKLTITGSISKVTAARVGTIVFHGDGNVVVAPGEPVVEDDGRDNTHVAG